MKRQRRELELMISQILLLQRSICFYTLTKYNSLNPVDLLECTKGSHYVSNNLILSGRGHGNKLMQPLRKIHLL